MKRNISTWPSNFSYWRWSPTPREVSFYRWTPFEDFHELRDKGGILRNLNVRVFYCVDKTNRAIVAIGVVAKKNDGATTTAVKARIRARIKKYRHGDFGVAPVNAWRRR